MTQSEEGGALRFADDLLVRAATLYYLQDATQGKSKHERFRSGRPSGVTIDAEAPS